MKTAVECEVPKTSENANECPSQKSSDLAQISLGTQAESELSRFGYSDNYRRFEEQFKQRSLPIWRTKTGNGGIDERFIEFIRKTLDKMGGEHTRGDAIIYITRREKTMDFDTLDARAQDWLNEEKKRKQTIKYKEKVSSDMPLKTTDISDLQAQIDVQLLRLGWKKVDAINHMKQHHGWVNNVVLEKAIQEDRFDRLTDEDLEQILINLKGVTK